MKKKLLMLVSIAVLSLSMVACGNKDKKTETKTDDSKKQEIKVGTWKTAQTIQPFLYDKFENKNENVEPFTNPGDMKTALLSGNIDFCGTTWVTAIMAASKGEPIKVVASMTEKCSALVVGKESNINDIKDLKGKTIAYVPGTMHHILLLEVLNRAGLDPNKDVTLKKIDFFDMGQALASKSIDAFCSGEPYPSIAMEDGYGKVLEYPYYDDSIGYINAAMITTDKEIKEDPELVQRMVDMHVESTKYLMDHKDEWIDMSAKFGTEKKYLEKSTENIDLTWDITPKTIEEVKKLAERMKEMDMIDKVPDVDAMFDLTFLDNAKKDLK